LLQKIRFLAKNILKWSRWQNQRQFWQNSISTQLSDWQFSVVWTFFTVG
jgi:hypothetical protein